MTYLVDTNFLIRLWRDARSPEQMETLQPYLNSEIRLVWVVKAEFLRGAIVAGHDVERVSVFLDRHITLWPDETTLRLYAQIYADLRRANALIGPHDLWIAATARQNDLPILTRNIAEFERVAGLEVLSY